MNMRYIVKGNGEVGEITHAELLAIARNRLSHGFTSKDVETGLPLTRQQVAAIQAWKTIRKNNKKNK